MDSLITLLGLLFFMFLVLSTAVEIILETFRGVLEALGVTWVKSKVSLEDALALTSEFTEPNSELAIKLQAMEKTANQVAGAASGALVKIAELKGDSSKKIQDVALRLTEISADIKEALDKEERKRVFVLRFITALIGAALVYKTEFFIFDILAKNPEAKQVFGAALKAQAEWVNVLVGGLAAAAGSSFWHDKLDTARKLKNVSSELKKLKS